MNWIRLLVNSNRRKVYLLSAAGYPNFGDEIILKNWVIFLLKNYPETEIWIDVPYPTNISFYFTSERIKVTNTLWRLFTETPYQNCEDFFETISNRICHLGSPNYDLALLKLREIDSFHIVGGGYINAIWKRNIGAVYAGIVLKKITGCRIYITGAGLLPAAISNNIALELFREYDFVEARDSDSAEAFSTNLGYDDAYLNLFDGTTGFQHRVIPQVMVSIQRDQLDNANFYSAVKALEGRIIGYINRNVSVGYVEAIPGEDRIAYTILKKYIPEDLFFNSMDTILHGLPLAPGQRWYSTRFHHHLIASLMGCAGVALSNSDGYYDVKHASLLANGTGWAYWNTMSEDALPFPRRRASFLNEVSTIIDSKRAIGKILYGFGD